MHTYIFILIILFSITSSANLVKIENDSNLMGRLASNVSESNLESNVSESNLESNVSESNLKDQNNSTSVINQSDTQETSLNSLQNLNLPQNQTNEASPSNESNKKLLDQITDSNSTIETTTNSESTESTTVSISEAPTTPTPESSTNSPFESSSTISSLLSSTNLPKNCVFYRLHNETRLVIEPKLIDFNNKDNSCLQSKSLQLSGHQIVSNGKLADYVDRNNTLQIQLISDSADSFLFKFYWLKLNSTILKSTDDLNYGILLTIYQNQKLIGKIFITDKLMINKSKEIKFQNLGNLSEYSIGLSKVNYFQIDLDTYLNQNHPENQLNDLDLYLITNVYQSIKANQNESTEVINSNGQIIIYTIASLLLLALVVSLLYYRRGKFKSLIQKHSNDTMPSYQNSKYVRKPKNPLSFSKNPFEPKPEIANIYSSNTERIDGFNHKSNFNNRDKLSSIGRVFEQSVATIKKRTALKSISSSTVMEFQDLKKMDPKYSNPIALTEFLPLFNELIKTNNQRLFNEYMELDILTNSFSTLKKSSNKVNRFSKNHQKSKDGTIQPYDHSRVVLEKNRFLTSDYYNASFIPGSNSLKEYIACQCPSKCSIYAFWLMCIQQNVKYILMTTQLFDSYTTMDKYWPDLFAEDGESIKHIENITIKLINKRKFNNYTVRTFEIKMDDEYKLIKHFQLTEWSENENNQNVTMITEFLRAFRENEMGFTEINNNWNESPIVVHCSNGIAKTAVLIAVDRLFVQLKKEEKDYIDIFGTVIEMRQYRPSMIQNQNQYRLIWECVAELVRKMYPDLVKQMEFDKTLDEINLNERNDFDTNNNLDASQNSQIFLILNSKSQEHNKLNGYTNQMFVSNEENS